jgi:hypothetical protein
LQVGDELLVSVDQAGRIVLTPKARLLEILERTAGMWEGRMATKASSLHSATSPRPSRRYGRALILALLLGGYMAAHANSRD